MKGFIIKLALAPKLACCVLSKTIRHCQVKYLQDEVSWRFRSLRACALFPCQRCDVLEPVEADRWLRPAHRGDGRILLLDDYDMDGSEDYQGEDVGRLEDGRDEDSVEGHESKPLLQCVGCKYSKARMKLIEIEADHALKPELHYLDGVWYIYYTAGSSANLDLQRAHVIKGKVSSSNDRRWC